jgi:dolichol-phosphate mannosyltransferase
VRTEVLKELKLNCAGFDLDFELTDKLLKNGYQIVEVPISYEPRSFEEGKKIRGKDGLKALYTILRDRFLG